MSQELQPVLGLWAKKLLPASQNWFGPRGWEQGSGVWSQGREGGGAVVLEQGWNYIESIGLMGPKCGMGMGVGS